MAKCCGFDGGFIFFWCCKCLTLVKKMIMPHCWIHIKLISAFQNRMEMHLIEYGCVMLHHIDVSFWICNGFDLFLVLYGFQIHEKYSWHIHLAVIRLNTIIFASLTDWCIFKIDFIFFLSFASEMCTPLRNKPEQSHFYWPKCDFNSLKTKNEAKKRIIEKW